MGRGLSDDMDSDFANGLARDAKYKVRSRFTVIQPLRRQRGVMYPSKWQEIISRGVIVFLTDLECVGVTCEPCCWSCL